MAMRTCNRLYIAGALLVLAFPQCKKPYDPVALTKGDNYLVVDGFIDTSPNGVTTIILSRTKNLTDTVVNIPERNAAVSVQNQSGTTYPLHEQGSDGNYISNPLQLNKSDRYKIVITTANGKQYMSDLVAARQTPAVDSISWRQDSLGVHVFANTHDPSNTTRYYRWQYIQTWEYHAQLQTPWGLNGNTIYVRDPVTEQTFICYRTTPSTDVLLGTSAALSQDVISQAPLFTVGPNDTTLAQRMSIQVKQYALTPEAYLYWQIIKKNSQQLGTLFDLQPSQLEGNIHSTDNAGEPVVGFISAGTMEEKRIFISVFDLRDWQTPPGTYNCIVLDIPTNPVDFSIWSYPDPDYVPWYFSGGSLRIAKKVCIDCRLSGGYHHQTFFLVKRSGN